MYVAQIWRYPVKSMKGAPLDRATVALDGIEGDRIVQVHGPNGKVITARTRPLLLGHQAALGPDGQPLVDGRPWTSPAVLKDVEKAIGGKARLTLDRSPERFDIRPLLITTDGAIAALGEDGRRLRPNLVIGGVSGLEERNWEGKLLCIGPVLIQMADLRGRCIMTTFHPDTLVQDTSVLRRIYKEFEGTMGLNSSVLRAGEIQVGDTVTLLDANGTMNQCPPAK